MTIPSRTPSAPRMPRGMTLVELLVVIVVIGILMGLLLPAVMKARSGARKAACANNLKQLAAAVHQFHERQGSMPTYFGAMHGRGGDLYGGWLLHLMPDLDQQVFYDSLERPPTVPRMQQVRASNIPIREALPPSDDYFAGTWEEFDVEVEEEYISGYEEVETGHVGIGTIQVPIYETRTVTRKQGRRVGATGFPGSPPVYEYRWQPTGHNDTAGMPPKFAALQSQVILPVLQCHDDPSPMLTAPVQGGTTQWSLTNYQASAHAFVNFAPPPTAALTGPGGRLLSSTILVSATMGGRFPRPIHTGNARGTNFRQFQHDNVILTGSVANSLLPRKFDHILDGLSNTILFGEGMRQCDGGASYRAAFLPTSSLGHEHAFGIEPSFLTTTGSALDSGKLGAFGNTMMFQLRPGIAGCNKFRIQSPHEDVLNVAMADGSTRGISATVSRREMADPDVSGRQPTPDVQYNAISLGGRRHSSVQYADGVWDMLLMPTDGQWPGNVLTNTGEVGKEK